MTSWKLEDAKNRFSEVVRRAGSEGLVDFLATSPLAAALREGELRLTRSPDLGRDVAI
jgi:hypothetical protein